MADDLFSRIERIVDLGPCAGERSVADALMRPERVEKLNLRSGQQIEVLLAGDEKMVEASLFDRLNLALDVHVLIGTRGPVGIIRPHALLKTSSKPAMSIPFRSRVT